MTVDHIGYAVKSIDKAKKAMEAIGYRFSKTIDDADRKIQIAFGELDGYRIELVSPICAGSPVDGYLTKMGPTPYHICYKSNCIEEDIEKLKAKRFKITVPLAPAIAFSGKRVVFMYSLAIGLLEIVEEDTVDVG